jgi:hypothetical protein
MNNEIETIDGVKGEWRTVTKPEEVTVGQRVRYFSDRLKIGYTGCPVFAYDNCERFAVSKKWLFKNTWTNIQAFFPLPVKPIKRKVAKVFLNGHTTTFCNEIIINNVNYYSKKYSSEKSAIRGAKRFCAAIGYECEIVK